jgi:hypothetical protein
MLIVPAMSGSAWPKYSMNSASRAVPNNCEQRPRRFSKGSMRNQRFASIGGLSAAAIMGARCHWVSAILRVRGADIHFGQSCGAPDHQATSPNRVSRRSLFKDVRLLAFVTCLFLFQLANASILPRVSQRLGPEGHSSSLEISTLIVVPQMLAPFAAALPALLSPRSLPGVGCSANFSRTTWHLSQWSVDCNRTTRAGAS